MKGNNMRDKQRGMTLIGFVIGLIVACFFAYMGMVLGPAYNEFFAVRKAMEFVAENTAATSTDKNAIVRLLNKQFNTGYVESVTGKDVEIIREKGGNLISLQYEVRKGFAYNIDFIVSFKHQVALGNKQAGE